MRKLFKIGTENPFLVILFAILICVGGIFSLLHLEMRFSPSAPLLTAQPLAASAQWDVQKISVADMQIATTNQQGQFLNAMLRTVMIAAVEALLLIVFMVFIVSGSLRSAGIPLLVLLLTPMAVFMVLNALGMPFHFFSVLALLLSVGWVVHGALAHFARCEEALETGLTPEYAAIAGFKSMLPIEIFLSGIAAVMIGLVIVWPGMLEPELRPLVFTWSCAVLLSIAFSLLLVPILSVWIFNKTTQNRFKDWLDAFFLGLSQRYMNSVRVLLQHRVLAWLGVFIFAMVGAGFYNHLSAAPALQEEIMKVGIEMHYPAGASEAYRARYLQQFEKKLIQNENIDHYSIAQASNTDKVSVIDIQVLLKNDQARGKKSEEVVAILKLQLAQMPGVDARARLIPLFSPATSSQQHLHLLFIQLGSLMRAWFTLYLVRHLAMGLRQAKAAIGSQSAYSEQKQTVSYLRPVLLFALLMSVSVLPLLLTRGPGSTFCHALAEVLLCGFLLSTIGSLYGVPLAYSRRIRIKGDE